MITDHGLLNLPPCRIQSASAILSDRSGRARRARSGLFPQRIWNFSPEVGTSNQTAGGPGRASCWAPSSGLQSGSCSASSYGTCSTLRDSPSHCLRLPRQKAASETLPGHVRVAGFLRCDGGRLAAGRRCSGDVGASLTALRARINGRSPAGCDAPDCCRGRVRSGSQGRCRSGPVDQAGRRKLGEVDAGGGKRRQAGQIHAVPGCSERQHNPAMTVGGFLQCRPQRLVHGQGIAVGE